MYWIDLIGDVGAIMFLLKIMMHIYLVKQVDKKFDIGASGNFLNPILFLPIFDDVKGNLKLLKIVANLLYIAAVIFILTFLIGNSFRTVGS